MSDLTGKQLYDYENVLLIEGHIEFEANGWIARIKRRDTDNLCWNVTLSKHPDHGNMVIDGQFFFKAHKTINEVVKWSSASMSQLNEMRSNPDAWPPSDRHIYYIPGRLTGHPNETGNGCLLVWLPLIIRLFQ